MNLHQTPHRSLLKLCRESACDDTPLSYGHRSNRPLRIILAGDHPVVLKGAEVALCAVPGSSFLIVGCANSADELIAHLECTPCDLLIRGYSMPCGDFPDGLALMGYLQRHFRHIPLIVMTMMHNPALLQALLNTGARGLFDKCSPLTELKQTALTVARGRRYLCPTFATVIDAQAMVTFCEVLERQASPNGNWKWFDCLCRVCPADRLPRD
ncbi:response regulator [Pseudomonas putida]|uniref:response regulator n=1 Tax=Pseudomonas putida TaxID=303 RepID=UPI003D9A06F3